MPFFVFCAHDKPGADGARATVREAHRSYIRIAQDGCRCVAGGPLMDETGTRMTGTLLVFAARDKKAVEAFVARDPYMGQEIFARIDIWKWNWGLGQPEEAEKAI
jgi:uncharacterized protein YciI